MDQGVAYIHNGVRPNDQNKTKSCHLQHLGWEEIMIGKVSQNKNEKHRTVSCVSGKSRNGSEKRTKFAS